MPLSSQPRAQPRPKLDAMTRLRREIAHLRAALTEIETIAQHGADVLAYDPDEYDAGAGLQHLERIAHTALRDAGRMCG